MPTSAGSTPGTATAGHGLGLEVHDPAQYYFAPDLFAPGDVFTVEPGIYVSQARLDRLPDTPRNRAMIARLRPVMQRYRTSACASRTTTS
jgi:Xaa-Pro aminopeptidase